MLLGLFSSQLADGIIGLAPRGMRMMMTTMSSEFLYYQLVFSAINTVQVFFFVFRRWRRFDRLWRSRLSTGLDADVLYETLCFYRLLSHYDRGCDLEWGQSCWSSQLLEPVLTLVRYWWWIEKWVSLSIVALLLRMFMPKPFTSWCKSSKQRVRRWTHHYISNSVFLAYIFINKHDFDRKRRVIVFPKRIFRCSQRYIWPFNLVVVITSLPMIISFIRPNLTFIAWAFIRTLRRWLAIILWIITISTLIYDRICLESVKPKYLFWNEFDVR